MIWVLFSVVIERSLGFFGLYLYVLYGLIRKLYFCFGFNIDIVIKMLFVLVIVEEKFVNKF